MKVDREVLRKVGALRLATPGRATGRSLGDRRSPYVGHGTEFADHRPYTPGDDLRLVDWNVYGRLGSALVRMFAEERNLSVALWVDASASMGVAGKAEHAATLAAALALVGLSNGDRVSVACLGGVGPRGAAAGQTTHALAAVLALLERTEASGDAGPGRALAAAGARRVDRAVLISDLLCPVEEREAALRALAAVCRRAVVLHVLSAEELAPDVDEPWELEDAETGEILPVRGNGARAYADALDRFRGEIGERCAALGVQLVPAYTTAPVAGLLAAALVKARVVEGALGGTA